MAGDAALDIPQRIVLQTRTHHVPGGDYHEKCNNMKNLLCQHLWNRNFDSSQDRWDVYRATFAYPNRRCYFLLDHGQSADANVPVFWYKWTGKSFVRREGPMPHLMRVELKKRPFMPEKRELKRVRPDAAMRRQMIRTRLRCGIKLPRFELEFLKDPEQVASLKEIIEPMFWDQIDELTRGDGQAAS
ncbi:hypothetical protein GGR50DRAFT_695438 [Xylaria sp. CBS 124048]|nr:hypothetical protein GGR50DRAFT_695438 [Xylaria sp. CBS 124048]